MVRMPEFCAPALGNKPNVVTIDAEVPANANGVLYKLGSAAGGLTCFFEDGRLCYEYNLFIIQRTKVCSEDKVPAGTRKIEIETSYVELRPAGPLKISLRVDGKVVAEGVVPISAPLLFTANDCLDIGRVMGSPVSRRLLRQRGVQVRRNDRAGARRVRLIGNWACQPPGVVAQARVYASPMEVNTRWARVRLWVERGRWLE